MQRPTAPRHEWLLTVWAVFVCSGSAAAGTLCTWMERGRETARQREYVLAVPPDNKVAGQRKKTTIPMLLMHDALAGQSWLAAGCVCPNLQGVMYGV